MASDPKKALASLSPTAAAEARALREEIEWIDDKDLRTLEGRDEGAAWALSMFFGGGGQLYTQQYLLGLGLIAADIGVLVAGLWPLYFVLGAVSSAFAFRSARRINRYVAARDESARGLGPGPAEYRLLAAMSAVDPNARADAARLVAAGVTPEPTATEALVVAGVDLGAIQGRLGQLAALRQNHLIDDEEYRERRIDALGTLHGLDRDQMDEVLFHLIDAINQGLLSAEDIDFLKRMGGT